MMPLSKFVQVSFFLLLSIGAYGQFGVKQEAGPMPMSGYYYNQQTVDFDADGDYDIVVLTSESIGWFENFGDEVFSAYVEIIAVSSVDFDITDFNSDGHLDIIFTTSDVFHYLENNGDETFLPPVYIGDFNPAGYGTGDADLLYCADFNGDGNEDVITQNFSLNLTYHEATGTGEIASDVELYEMPFVISPTSLNAKDVDEDGDLDLFYSDFGGKKLLLARNLGDATFEYDTIKHALPHYPYSMDLVDFNNDGLLDAVYTGISGVGWMKNLGGDEFGAVQVISVESEYPSAVRSGDIDLDGFQDIVYLDEDENRLIWVQNLGDETFGEPVVISEELTQPGDLNLVDIDSDGDLDIIAGEKLGTSLGIFYNQTINGSIAEGELFIDINENGIWDDDEIPLTYVGVSSTPEGAYSVSQESGRYIIDFMGLPEDTYEIAPNYVNWGISTEYDSYDVDVFFPMDVMDTLDFGMYPEVMVDSITVDWIQPATYRCNKIQPFYVNYKNVGSTIANGTLHLRLDDSLTYHSTDFAPDSIVGQDIYWSYSDLYYFESRDILVNAVTPDGIEDTSLCELNGTIIVDGDVVYNAEPDIVSEVVVCAYDPNDKQVSPKGVGPEGNIPPDTEWLEYIIRFQNTGTDTAFVVIIRDELDVNLNWLTFEPLSSSHSMYVDYNPTGEVAFIFDDIMLPDSSVNFEESQGYVRYRIRPNAELSIGSTIENTAAIYFDANPAVITNTTLNTIYLGDVDGIEELQSHNSEMLIYPNPTNGITHLQFNSEIPKVYSIKLYNLMGEVVLELNDQSGATNQFNTNLLEKGLYVIVIEDSESLRTVFQSKLIIQ